MLDHLLRFLLPLYPTLWTSLYVPCCRYERILVVSYLLLWILDVGWHMP